LPRLGVTAQPLTRNFGPNVIFDPRFGFVADPPRLAREKQNRISFAWKNDERVAVNNLEPRDVTDGTLESGVLISADDQCVGVCFLESSAEVGVAAGDLGG